MFGIWIRKFLGLQAPDPLVRGTDPDPDPSLFRSNAYKIRILTQISFKTKNKGPKYNKKIWNFFKILTEERIWIRSWIRIHYSEVRIRIHTKM